MNAMKIRYYFLHDGEGRILAVVPAAGVEIKDGIQVGWRPVAGVNQFVAEVELAAAHARVAPQELIAEFRVHLNGKNGSARIRRRTIRDTAAKGSSAERSPTSRRSE
jgi:hypothetical protein